MGRKSATKKKQVEEEEEYEIDSIIDAMIGGVRGRPKTLSYFGYPESDNCWVTDGDANNASELVKKFWYHNPDLYVDLGLKPNKVEKPQSLINREKGKDIQQEEDLNDNNEDQQHNRTFLNPPHSPDESDLDNGLDHDVDNHSNEDHHPAIPADDADDADDAADAAHSDKAATVDPEPESDTHSHSKLHSHSQTLSQPPSRPKRGRGRPSKASLGLNPTEKQTKSKKFKISSYDDAPRWDNHLDILGVSRSDVPGEKAMFKVQFDDARVNVYGFEELVERAPKTLCRYLSMYMDFDKAQTDNSEPSRPLKRHNQDGKTFFEV
ncbi:hypothetical protein E3P84_02427 [Wallemia ichthyophaga]|nr:hypothetical protein E3P84_02427 [Wallemia ichthyophaga]TIB41085.1 hypothetical protein E3P83_02380 [Wallemia ichthyophaga]